MLNIFTKEWLIERLYMLPVLLLALSIHELAHAYVAYKLGDRSQKAMGRLTLDPFAHIDWAGFICFIFTYIGWGKPVYVNDSSFKNKSKGNMLVALAGPVSNLSLAIVLTVILKLTDVFGVLTVIQNNVAGSIVIKMLTIAIQVNVVLAVFNMLPIPPFDGSKVLFYFLPYKYKGLMYKLEAYSLIIIAILFFTGLAGAIISPFVNGIYYVLNWILGL